MEIVEEEVQGWARSITKNLKPSFGRNHVNIIILNLKDLSMNSKF